MENYNVDYFIKKFEAIQEAFWYEGSFVDPTNISRKCALGHCMFDYNGHSEMDNLQNLFTNHLFCAVGAINDNKIQKYNQPTPKQRILAALYDIKKMNSEQGVQECDATMPKKVVEVGSIKTVTKYVAVPITISESLPETILS